MSFDLNWSIIWSQVISSVIGVGSFAPFCISLILYLLIILVLFRCISLWSKWIYPLLVTLRSVTGVLRSELVDLVSSSLTSSISQSYGSLWSSICISLWSKWIHFQFMATSKQASGRLWSHEMVTTCFSLISCAIHMPCCPMLYGLSLICQLYGLSFSKWAKSVIIWIELHCIKFIRAFNENSSSEFIFCYLTVSYQWALISRSGQTLFCILTQEFSSDVQWQSYGFLWSTSFCISFYCPILLNMSCVTWCHVYKKVTVDYVLLCGKKQYYLVTLPIIAKYILSLIKLRLYF